MERRWTWPSASSAILAVLMLLLLPGLYRYSMDLPGASPRERTVFRVACLLWSAAEAGLALWSFQPHRWEGARRNVTAVVATLFLLGGVEAVLARVSPNDPQHAGLLFPPHSSAHYVASEFVFDARINNLGFRDADVPLSKPAGRYRILAIGDSTTYGWGVPLEQAWPKRLEAELREWGLPVDVLDLGKPGTGPVQYADVAETAIPLLHPDMVIVGLLQGDDLRQSNNTMFQNTRLGHLASRPAEEVFPTLTRWITDRTIMHTQQTGPEWQEEVRNMEKGLDAAQRQRLASIDPQVRQGWESGRVNPGSFVLGIKYPNYFTSVVDLHDPVTELLIKRCGRALSRIRRVADGNGCQVVTLSLPWGLYISPHDYDDFKRLGIDVDPRMLSTDNADEAFRQAAALAGVPFLTFTPELRHESAEHHLFYDLDCHFNPFGNQYFADLIAPSIENQIRPHLVIRPRRP